jgi:hypothetical protein
MKAYSVDLRQKIYARALKGERATGDRPNKQGKNVTLIGAISWEGKEFLRSVAARTHEALDRAITDALAGVTLKDIQGWFANRCYCTSLS